MGDIVESSGFGEGGGLLCEDGVIKKELNYYLLFYCRDLGESGNIVLFVINRRKTIV